MIKAEEKGRRLHITVGDGEEAERFIVEPVDVETGAALLVHFLGMVSADAGDDPEEAAALAAKQAENATQWSKLALGETNYRRVNQLRADEARQVVYAAYFWNSQGGGAGVMKTFLEDGLGKAMAAVFEAAGLRVMHSSLT